MVMKTCAMIFLDDPKRRELLYHVKRKQSQIFFPVFKTTLINKLSRLSQ